jgi:type IV pilus assembly protein PilB
MKLPFAFNTKLGFSEQQKRFEEHSDDRNDSVSGNTPICGLTDIYTPEKVGESHVQDITDVLLEMGKLSPEQYEHLQNELSENQFCDVAALLLKNSVVTREEIQIAKAKLYNLEFRHIEPQSVKKEIFEKLDIDFIRSNRLVPIAIKDNVLVAATSEPTDVIAIEDAKRQTQMELELVVCNDEDIDAVCKQFREKGGDANLDDIISDITKIVRGEESTLNAISACSLELRI